MCPSLFSAQVGNAFPQGVDRFGAITGPAVLLEEADGDLADGLPRMLAAIRIDGRTKPFVSAGRPIALRVCASARSHRLGRAVMEPRVQPRAGVFGHHARRQDADRDGFSHRQIRMILLVPVSGGGDREQDFSGEPWARVLPGLLDQGAFTSADPIDVVKDRLSIEHRLIMPADLFELVDESVERRVPVVCGHGGDERRLRQSQSVLANFLGAIPNRSERSARAESSNNYVKGAAYELIVADDDTLLAR